MLSDTPTTPTTLIGRRYHLQEVLGKGGMGAVYRALDRLTGQTIALKRVITADMDLSFSSTYHVMDFRVSLAQEFKLLASLRHPNIIAVLDYGFDAEREPYYTMELLENAETLLDAGRNKPLRYKLELIVQALQALAYLHRRGILHRDLKPQNVLVAENTVKVLDFGLSVMRDRSTSTSEDLGITSGTLGYMAPEVLMGHPATEAADLYAIGVIAYELLADRHLFDLGDIGKLVNDVLYTQPELDAMDVTVPVAQIIGRLLAKTPEERFKSANEAISALTKTLDNTLYVETEATRDSYLQAAQFIGRDAELDQLSRALQKAIQGEGSLQLIAGESGVGKSRLVDELRTLALVEGAIVVQGYAVNAASVPYQMWRPMLGWLPLLRDLSDEEATIIRAIAPDLPTLPSIKTPATLNTLDPQTAQSRLLKLIRETLVAHQQPVLLILDDLHWAGSESRALLAQLMPMMRTMRLLVVGSFRDDEQPDLPVQYLDANVLKLNRLSEEQIALLSGAMLGEAGSQPHVVDLLKRETEGNVFFIIEVIRTLAEEAGQLEQIGLMTLPQQVFAGGMWRIIERRLKHVPDYAIPLLQFAAVIGRQLDLNLLHRLMPSINLDRWLLDCGNAAVLEVMESAWRFTHDKLREGVLEGLNTAQRRQLHAQVAAAIETLHGTNQSYVPALAYHWGLAEDEKKEVLYTRLAGEQAVRLGAYREAITYLERTLELLPKADTAALITVQHKQAEAYLGIGGYDQAKRLYRAALKLAEQTQNQAALAETFFRLGDVYYAQSRLEDAQKQYAQSRDLYTQLNDNGGLARVLNALGNLAYDRGDSQTAKQLYQESLALTRGTGAIQFMAGAMRSDAASTDIHDTQEFDALLKRLDSAMEAGDKPSTIGVLFELGEAAHKTKRMADAREYYTKSAAIAREIDDSAAMAKAYHALGQAALTSDDRQQARLHFQHALKAARTLPTRELALEVLLGIAQYFYSSATGVEIAVELVAFVLYHPEATDDLQDRTDNLAFELQSSVTPLVLEHVWERGKNRAFDEFVLEILKML